MKNYTFNQMPVFTTKDPHGKQIRIKFKTVAKVDRELTEAEKIRGNIKKTKEQKDPRKKFNLLDDWGFDDWARRLDDEQKKDLLALLESDPEMDKTLYYED